MAKLKAFVEKLEDVTEEFRDLYVEDADKDGKKRFKLDADGLEDVTGLRSTVATLRTENRKLKDRAKPLESLAEEEDPEAIITAGRAAIEAQRTGAPIPAVENVKKQMQTAHEKETRSLKAEIEGMQSSLREALIDAAATTAITDPTMKGNKTLLMPHIKTVTDIVKVEGKDGKVRFEARVFEGDGDERAERLDGAGKPLSIKALVAELREKDEFADAFQGTVVPGSGTPADGGGGMPTPPGRTRSSSEPTSSARKDAKRATVDYSI